MKRQIAQSVRGIVRLAGIDLHPYSKTEWKWGYDVHEYYPVTPTARWGYGKPPHSKMTEILDRNDYSGLIDTISRFGDLYASVPQKGNPDGTVPFWQQSWFHDFDAVALMGIIASKRPKRYFGSGNSTKFARHTIERNNLPTKITSLDPNPRASIDALCDRVIRYPLEDCDLVLFDELERGDILFFDGSHRVFTNSDVTVFFLELLQRLKPGVFVQIHDIFLPWDYLPVWEKRLYSEQYMLAAMLVCPIPPFNVMLPNWHLCHHPEYSRAIGGIMKSIGGKSEGASFWLEMASGNPGG
jgi:hypothetical protein